MAIVIVVSIALGYGIVLSLFLLSALLMDVAPLFGDNTTIIGLGLAVISLYGIRCFRKRLFHHINIENTGICLVTALFIVFPMLFSVVYSLVGNRLVFDFKQATNSFVKFPFFCLWIMLLSFPIINLMGNVLACVRSHRKRSKH